MAFDKDGVDMEFTLDSQIPPPPTQCGNCASLTMQLELAKQTIDQLKRRENALIEKLASQQ